MSSMHRPGIHRTACLQLWARDRADRAVGGPRRGAGVPAWWPAGLQTLPAGPLPRHPSTTDVESFDRGPESPPGNRSLWAGSLLGGRGRDRLENLAGPVCPGGLLTPEAEGDPRTGEAAPVPVWTAPHPPLFPTCSSGSSDCPVRGDGQQGPPRTRLGARLSWPRAPPPAPCLRSHLPHPQEVRVGGACEGQGEAPR